MKYRITKKQSALEQMRELVRNEADQYFDMKLLLEYEMGEGFVDGGAYIGDTIIHFFRHLPDWKGNYYCFEAESEFVNTIKETHKHNNSIHVFNIALWNRTERVKFIHPYDEFDAGGSVGMGGGQR